MDLMVVYSRNNEVKYELPSYEPLLTIESAKAQRQLMSNDYVQIQVKGSTTLDLEIGDWIEVKGAKYSIRTISDVSRTGEDTFVYNITFYGVMYELMRYKYRNTSINGRSSQNTFDLTFTLKEFLRLIVYNVMRVEGISEENINNSPWVFDENNCPETNPITMSFDQQNCLSALQNITKEFDVEFRIIQEFNEATKKWKNTIKVGKFGDVINATPFSYGMGNGLYQLQENKVDDSMITNRLYVEGGMENILSGYRGYSTRIQLPRKDVPRIDDVNSTQRYSRYKHTVEIDGEKITFSEGYPIGIDDDESRYIDENILHQRSLDESHSLVKDENSAIYKHREYVKSNLVEKYGVIEDSVVIDDVIPSPVFEITNISSENSRFTFECNVDFDLKEIWENSFSDFREWCLLKTQIVPTMDEYIACLAFDNSNEFESSNQGIILGWKDYKKDFAIGKTSKPYIGWRNDNIGISVQPSEIPLNFNQDVYEQYCIYKDFCISGANSKYLIDGGSVVFIDGKLSGLEFQIAESSFNVTTNRTTLTINAKTEPETDDVFPSEDEFGAFRFRIGDTFKLTNIYLPYKYYEDAEEELWFRGYEKFENVKNVSCQYKLTFDKMFVYENIELFDSIQCGDYITITDDRFGITDKKMRVTQIDFDITNTYNYSVTLDSVHKTKTRYNYRVRKADEALQAISEMRFDEPLYRRNNRTSGTRVMGHILDGNGCVKDIRVADSFIAERMIETGAVSSNKIKEGAVTSTKIGKSAITSDKIQEGAVSSEKLDKNVSTALSRVDVIQFFRRYINNGSNQDKYYRGSIVLKNNILSFKDVVVTDSVSKSILRTEKNTWTTENVDIDLTKYDDKKSHIVYGVLKDDGTFFVEIIATDKNSFVADNYLEIAEIGEYVSDDRKLTMHIGKSYMLDGVLRDSEGNTIIDISRGIVNQRRNDGTFVSVKDIDDTIGSTSKPNTLMYRTANLEFHVGESENEEGTLLYRMKLSEAEVEKHKNKINETIESLYSADQILLKFQNSFNSVLGKLNRNSIITEEEEKALRMGIERCEYDRLHETYVCTESAEGIGVPEIIGK